ncbi:MAG: hypothetical protein V4739_13780 [Pseudomonadota bacterium]
MTCAQHLVIPFAHATAEGCTQALRDLRLPHLSACIARWNVGPRVDGDDFGLSTPHERVLASVWGWAGGAGALPFAAQAAQADGIDTGDLAWGLMTPTHWHVGRDQITLLDPAGLELDADTSRGLLEAVRDLFESEGMVLAYGAPLRWYVAHETLAELPCASLDRVIGRNVDAWLPAGPRARLIRRLQNEVQMLLYQSPLNDAREAQGRLPVNSFWLSGCGSVQPVPAQPPVRVLDTLRAPALEQDWAAWTRAWEALDQGPLAELGNAVDLTLTLCGERSSQSWLAPAASPWPRWVSAWRRPWRSPPLSSLLGTL